MPILLLYTAVAASCLVMFLVSGYLPPKGQPLPNADRMQQIVHLGLFTDKPQNMSYLDYFRNLTGGKLSENLTRVIERLEFGVLDYENLDIAVKLAEDARQLKQLEQMAASARRSDLRQATYEPQHIFSYRDNPYAWTVETRQKVIQFMQHSVYASRYEIDKLINLRKKYQNSTVFKIGVVYGNSLELSATAGNLYTTMSRMPSSVTLLWYIYHYHKLLNMAYDVSSNTEYIYLLNDRLKAGFQHLYALEYTPAPGYSMPLNADEMTSLSPDNLYKKKKK